jgi:hypothetical protein
MRCSARCLRQADSLSRPKDSTQAALFIARCSPQPQCDVEMIDAKRRPGCKLPNPMLFGNGRRCTAERRSDRPVSPPHHHRFRSAGARPLMALFCRRLRRGADGQKLSAAPAQARL